MYILLLSLFTQKEIEIKVKPGEVVNIKVIGESPQAQLYVSPTGNDANPGTKELPIKSLSLIDNRTQNGDLVLLRSGVYKGSSISWNSSSPKNVTIAAYPNEQPILDGEFKRVYGVRVERNSLKIEGLTCRYFTAYGIGHVRPTGVFVKNCIAYGNGSAGIVMNYAINNPGVLVEDCITFLNGWRSGWASGIHL